MVKKNKILSIFLFLIFISFTSKDTEIGTQIDTFQEIAVYYNGSNFKNVLGRSIADDGYNLGLKYQCVEFVKRYYYHVFEHKMANSFGHAKDFFDKSLSDRDYNKQRGLMQYRNVREYKPEIGDLIVFEKSFGNPFGHVAIISSVSDGEIEIVQQNMGLDSRRKIPLVQFYNYWTVADELVLGWLRKE